MYAAIGGRMESMMKKNNKIAALLLGVFMLAVQLPPSALANEKPDYLQFPYFDDFESCGEFTAAARSGSVAEDAAPEMLNGELPEAYDGTTITKAANSGWKGTIETYFDGVERMIKSTRNYSSRLNFDIGEFEPGLLSSRFTTEMRFKADETVSGDGSAVPRVYAEIAKNALGTNGNDVNDTIKLFFMVQGSIRIANNSEATSSTLLTDPDSNETFVMSPDKWYTIRCTYDFTESANNLTVTLMGERDDGTYIETSKTTTLILTHEFNASELTRFRYSHYDSDTNHNGKSVVYYKDLSFYKDEEGMQLSKQMPFYDDFESYEPFEAQAQLANTNGIDYPPVMNYGTLPANYKSITMTPSLTNKNRGFIDLAEEENGNRYIRIKVDKSWGRNNIDIGPFERGVLSGDKIKASFRTKMGEPGDTDHPGIMILLSQTGAGNNNDNINSVPLMYFWPDRVLLFKKPVDDLKSFRSSWDSADSAVSRVGNLRLTTGTWYDFECEFDFSEQKMSVKIKNEDTEEITESSVDSMSWCPEDFDPNKLTTFRIRSDGRGSRDYYLTAGFDDISLTVIPKFKFTADIEGQTNVSPVSLDNIEVKFPQIKADAATINSDCVMLEPYTENMRVYDVSEDGFKIDMSQCGALAENTEYKLSLNGILSEDGEELANDTVSFRTGELEKHMMYRDTFEFSAANGRTEQLKPGKITFSMDTGNYGTEPITFAMGLYEKDASGYDTMLQYGEETVSANERKTVSKSFNVPSAESCYIKGYFLSAPVESIAQDFVFDASGLHFTERAETVYNKINYYPQNITANGNTESIGNICDGDAQTFWETSGNGSSITVDMGEAADIDFVQMSFCKSEDGTMDYRYTVSVSEDGADFADVASGSTLNRGNLRYIQNKFPAVRARYVRISKDSGMSGEMRISGLGMYRITDNRYWAFN